MKAEHEKQPGSNPSHLDTKRPKPTARSFADGRPEAAQLLEIQERIRRSPTVASFAQLQSKIRNNAAPGIDLGSHSSHPVPIAQRMSDEGAQSAASTHSGGSAEKEKETKSDKGQVVLPDAVFAKLSPKAFVELSSEEICKTVQPILTEYLNRVNYNSLEDAVAFLDHLGAKRVEKDSTTPQEAFGDFNYQSLDSVKKAKGAQCVGQGIQLAHQIIEQTKYPAYPCAAKFAGKEYFGHGAALIAFCNPKDEQDAGYILLDPGFNVSEPVVITKAVPGKVRSNEYRLTDKDEAIESYNKDALVVSFPTGPILNPDPAVTKSALLAYASFTVVSRVNPKKKTFLQLDLRGQAITVAVLGKKKSLKLPEAGKVDEFIAKDLSDLITDELAEALGYKPEEADIEGASKARLIDSLGKVIRGRMDILALQDSNVKSQGTKNQD